MRGLCILAIPIITLLGCSNAGKASPGPRAYITGNAQCVGAKIYVDDRLVGEMDKVEDSATRVVRSVGVDLEIKQGKRKPEYGVYSDIRIAVGEHELLIVTMEGKQLRKYIDVETETYIGLDCMTMSISGDR